MFIIGNRNCTLIATSVSGYAILKHSWILFEIRGSDMNMRSTVIIQTFVPKRKTDLFSGYWMCYVSVFHKQVSRSSYHIPHIQLDVTMCARCYQKKVTRAGTFNYTSQISWYVSTCPCHWYLLLTHQNQFGNYRVKNTIYPKLPMFHNRVFERIRCSL